MSKFDASIDYLELLGLDLSEGSKPSVEQLRQAIREKRKEWTAQAVNPLYQQEARRNLDVIRGFEKVLSRPEALKDYLKQLSQLHGQKRQVQEREVGNLIRAAVSSRGYLTTRQRELLVEQVAAEQITEQVVDAVIERMGIELRTPDRLATQSPELPYETPALDKTVLAQVSNWLKILEVKSFYELLDLPVYAPLATIRSTAEMHFSRWSKVLPKSTEVVAWEKSLQACLTWIKDDKSREQYNSALFNEHIDQFARRIDLLLAAGQMTRDDQIELTRIGTREFGLSASVVSRCIHARVVAGGIALERPVTVTVQMRGQTQCMRCYSWNPRQNQRCWSCGGALIKRCANPSCRKRINNGSRACESCNLRTGHGKRFATLLNMGDEALRRADWETAIPAYRSARRILNTDQLTSRLNQASRIRKLLVRAQEQIADCSLSMARETLAELLQLAPEMDVAGLPTLEELSAQLRRFSVHCKNIQQMDDPLEAAENWALMLEKWNDCNTAYHSLRVLCESLARTGQSEAALEYARLLLNVKPNDDTLRRWTIKIQQWQSSRPAPQPEIHEPHTKPHANGNGHANGNNGKVNGVHKRFAFNG